MANILKILMCLALLFAYVTCLTCSTVTSPSINVNQIVMGANTITVSDYNGYLKSSHRNTVSWTAKSLPNNMAAQYISSGVNDDLCAIDQNYAIQCVKYGYTTWVNVPAPLTSGYIVQIGIYAYGNNAMVVSDSYMNSFLYGSGSWSEIGTAANNPMVSVDIASDGTIVGVNAAGNTYQYNGTPDSWTQTSSGLGMVQVAAGASVSDMAAVSFDYPFIDYIKSSGSFTQFSTTKSNLGILNGIVYATDGTNVYICQ